MKITLVPTAGLCNRLNAILSAIALHNRYGYPINIVWEKTKDCYAEFEDLFQPLDIDGISISPLRKFYLKPGGKRNLFIPNILRKIKFDASHQGRLIRNLDFQDLTKEKSEIYIASYNQFCPLQIPELIGEYFKPTLEIETIIQASTREYFGNTIGVHIRQTDNIPAIKNNPIQKFIDLMDQEILKDINCRFYLASDSIEAKKMLIKKYGNRIISNNVELKRYTVKGMKDATAELYCLGRTKKIIGCTNSTYSIIASQLYNIALTV